MANLNKKNILATGNIGASMSTIMANQDGTLKRTNAVETGNGNTSINGNIVTLGDEQSSIKVPNLAGGGLIEADNNGNLSSSNIKPSTISSYNRNHGID